MSSYWKQGCFWAHSLNMRIISQALRASLETEWLQYVMWYTRIEAIRSPFAFVWVQLNVKVSRMCLHLSSLSPGLGLTCFLVDREQMERCYKVSKSIITSVVAFVYLTKSLFLQFILNGALGPCKISCCSRTEFYRNNGSPCRNYQDFIEPILL